MSTEIHWGGKSWHLDNFQVSFDSIELPVLKTLIERACNPQIGDEFTGLDGSTKMIVANRVCIDGVEEVHCVHLRDGVEIADEFSLRLYCELATNAIQGGHTFHPVPDWEDEE